MTGIGKPFVTLSFPILRGIGDDVDLQKHVNITSVNVVAKMKTNDITGSKNHMFFSSYTLFGILKTEKYGAESFDIDLPVYE